MKRPERRRGSVLLLAAVCLVIIFAFTAFAVDLGYIALVRGQLQNAADASSLAGAQALEDGSAAAVAAAIAIAAENEAGNQPVRLLTQDVEIGRWDTDAARFVPLSGAAREQANAVRVTCLRSTERGTAVPLFFAPVLRIFQAEIRVHAVARLKMMPCGGVFGRDRVSLTGSILVDSYDSTNGTYEMQSRGEAGHVCSNGPIFLTGAATIYGDAHPGPGHDVHLKGSARVAGDIEPLRRPLRYRAIETNGAETYNDNHEIPLTNRGQTALDDRGRLSLTGNDSLDLPPGTYYFTALELTGNVAVYISGPTTIYVAGDVNVTGSGFVNDTQQPGDLQLYVMGDVCDLRGSADFHGVVYAPEARVDLTGAADIFGMVVGREVVMTGGLNGGIHVDESLADLDIVPKRAVLVE